MCGIGDEGALLIEGALETLEDAFEGVGERGEFRGFAGGCGRVKGPRFGGDLAGEGCEFAQRGEAAVQYPRDKRAGDENEEEHAGGVEFDGSIDGMPDVFGRGSIDDGDEAEMAAANFAGIDNPRTGETEKTVALVRDLRSEEAV